MQADVRKSLTFSLRLWGFCHIKIHVPGSSFYKTRWLWRRLCQQDTAFCSKRWTVRFKNIRVAQRIKHGRSTCATDISAPLVLYSISRTFGKQLKAVKQIWWVFVDDTKRIKPTRRYAVVYWTLWFAQHVSGIVMPIIRSLRLYRWPQRVAPHLGYGRLLVWCMAVAMHLTSIQPHPSES
jgi:hypothetical protein